MSDLKKVLLEVKDADIHVQVLTETPDGWAIGPNAVFFQLGTVRESTAPGARADKPIKVWRWMSDGETGIAKSKAKAIEGMLADWGFEAAPLTVTIPDLLDGLS